MLVGGITVEYADQDGGVQGDQVRVLGFDQLQSNHWVVVNQMTAVEHRHERRPDIALPSRLGLEPNNLLVCVQEYVRAGDGGRGVSAL